MKIFPAIDLYDNKAVRLFKGDYAQMTVYNENPVAVARDFKKQGAEQIHLVDLAGAKTGVPTHTETVRNSVRSKKTVHTADTTPQNRCVISLNTAPKDT